MKLAQVIEELQKIVAEHGPDVDAKACDREGDECEFTKIDMLGELRGDGKDKRFIFW
jgi:hypothetical protein